MKHYCDICGKHVSECGKLMAMMVDKNDNNKLMTVCTRCKRWAGDIRRMGFRELSKRKLRVMFEWKEKYYITNHTHQEDDKKWRMKI